MKTGIRRGLRTALAGSLLFGGTVVASVIAGSLPASAATTCRVRRGRWQRYGKLPVCGVALRHHLVRVFADLVRDFEHDDRCGAGRVPGRPVCL